jgi:type I restriction enzyme R subunit
VHLYSEIVKQRPDWQDAGPERGAIKIVVTGSASDKALLRPVIVLDMRPTGFDAPCMRTLYTDKPMRDHNLMQAVARVKRVLRDPQEVAVDLVPQQAKALGEARV